MKEIKKSDKTTCQNIEMFVIFVATPFISVFIFPCQNNRRAQQPIPREAVWLGIGAPLSKYFYICVGPGIFCHESSLQSLTESSCPSIMHDLLSS